MGETSIDEETFDEYLNEMREHYTADKVRSSSPTALCLIYSQCSQVSPPRYATIFNIELSLSSNKVYTDFNCNSFTNDCVGFLTGQSIPAWIKGTLLAPS